MNATKWNGWTLKEENVKTIINNLRERGRYVNEEIAWEIFKKRFENKPINTEYMGTVCDWFSAAIWNAGAVQ